MIYSVNIQSLSALLAAIVSFAIGSSVVSARPPPAHLSAVRRILFRPLSLAHHDVPAGHARVGRRLFRLAGRRRGHPGGVDPLFPRVSGRRGRRPGHAARRSSPSPPAFWSRSATPSPSAAIACTTRPASRWRSASTSSAASTPRCSSCTASTGARCTRVEKTRIKYLLIGGVAAIGFAAADFLPRIGVPFPALGNVLTIVYLYFISQTLFRYRLLDLDRAARPHGRHLDVRADSGGDLRAARRLDPGRSVGRLLLQHAGGVVRHLDLVRSAAHRRRGPGAKVDVPREVRAQGAHRRPAPRARPTSSTSRRRCASSSRRWKSRGA